MRKRVSDYVADFMAEHGVTDIFTVTGGGAMYLNDSLGHHPGLHCIYNHHEQASAMAAEAYARIHNRPALVCVTSGPGATNAITGVAGGWMDSIPMLVISGQVRYATSIYATELCLRTRGVQEFDIVGSVGNMTKYCAVVESAEDIRYHLEKALYYAMEGRPGPCWLDIPMDIQGASIETEDLRGFSTPKTQTVIAEDEIDTILARIESSARPLLFVGNGVRLAGAHTDFLKLVDKLNIPVVEGMSSVDAIATDHNLYAGRTGGTGDRAGNFAMQNCDLLLSLGSRLSFLQTGFNYEKWAPRAFKIVNDIDAQELEKDSIAADVKISADVKEFIGKLLKKLSKPLNKKKKWVEQCQRWKERYPVVQKRQYEDTCPNIYTFYHEMTSRLSETDVIVTGAGTARVAGSQASVIKEGMRFITNTSMAAMGYDLPAAIGVTVARKGKRVIVVTGDGSLQMNIQELQTIIQNRFPIILFVMNNQGYHSIRMTQRQYFSEPLVGVGPESGDISFPNLKKIADAYGIPFRRCSLQSDMVNAIEWALNQNGFCICEMMLSIEQMTEPKVASRKLENGRMVSTSLEEMYPFLPEEEMKENMRYSLGEK